MSVVWGRTALVTPGSTPPGTGRPRGGVPGSFRNAVMGAGSLPPRLLSSLALGLWSVLVARFAHTLFPMGLRPHAGDSVTVITAVRCGSLAVVMVLTL